MSVTTTIPSIKISTCSSSPCCSSPTTSSHSLRYKPYYNVFTIRNSQAEGPLRRPVAPPVREEPSGGGSPPQPLKPSPPSPNKPASSYVVVDDNNVVTLEFQRQKAKELQEYFKQKKLDDADQGPAFGFIGKNEINNGRWAMFGFAVGLLTEYATGSDFVDQVKILLSNFGILDLE